MRSVESVRQEAKEDLYYGQVVVIISRWGLILAGVVLSLWSATSIGDVFIPVICMTVMMGTNFYLHGRYLMNRPVNARLVYATSAMDVTVVTLMVVFWRLGTGAGIDSPFFVFYYPVLLSFALVFPPRMTAVFTSICIAVYLAIVAFGGIGDVVAQRMLVERTITLVATAALGTFFWRTERQRRDRRTDASRLLDEVARFSDSIGPSQPARA